jgi:hypothetical protein
MKLRSLILAAAASIALASPAFALCQQQTVLTPNTNPVYGTKITTAGSATNQGYGGIPGQNGCPIKAAVGTCVTANASLSEKVQGNADYNFFFGNIGDVPDYTQRRIGIQVGQHWIGTQWQGTAENPKTCS